MQKIEFVNRIKTVSQRLAENNQDLLLITPGADLRYLTGYDALPLERLTCLAIHQSGKAWLIVPTLEKPSAIAHQIEELNIELIDWDETVNPYKTLANRVGKVNRVLVNNLMWVEKAWHLQEVFNTKVNLAGRLLADLRAIKSAYEIQALHEAGKAIDQVHEQMYKWLLPGRTERQVGRDISNAIFESGHKSVDFVIVASGPNGASPHHEVSNRVIEKNDPVVVDIGGTMQSGYCSDSTRTYVCGKASRDFQNYYEALQAAQKAACDEAIVGVSFESVDQRAREILNAAGLGKYFIHRTGHGIGLETHEDPYLVSGNQEKMENGHAFSIEPGFYLANKFGARIEDILVCQNGKAVSTNNTSHNLAEL